MDLGEEILSQYIAEKQNLQVNRPSVSAKPACTVTKLWRDKPRTDQTVNYDYKIEKILKSLYLILIFWKIKSFIAFIKEW